MNNQKDNQKTSLDYYNHLGFYSDKALINKPNYDFIFKKTEKLITALYMVTDCMEYEDALKSKLRSLGVDLLSDIYKLDVVVPPKNYSYLLISMMKIKEVISFIEIAQTIGFVSEMNSIILKNQFEILFKELESYKTKGKHFSFTLNSKMFDIERPSFQNNLNIKDKKTSLNTMSFINKNHLQNFDTKPNNDLVKNMSDREDRIKKILEIIKDKQYLPNNSDGVSIKDISMSFMDVSEKTIQRELNSLLLKNKIKKTGNKRWSKYKLT